MAKPSEWTELSHGLMNELCDSAALAQYASSRCTGPQRIKSAKTARSRGSIETFTLCFKLFRSGVERQWSISGASVVFQAFRMLRTISIIAASTQTGRFTHSHAESNPETPPFTGKSLLGPCLLPGDVDSHATVSWCLAQPDTRALAGSVSSVCLN